VTLGIFLLPEKARGLMKIGITAGKQQYDTF